MRHYKELPHDYEESYVIDAKNTKTAIIFNAISTVIMLITFLVTVKLKMWNVENYTFRFSLTELLLLLICLILVLVIHELIHGLFYKIFTKEKLAYGTTLAFAFCGVPSIFVKRNTMLVTALAPTVIWSCIFICLILFIPLNSFTAGAIILFSSHLGGCTGDIYLSAVLLIKYDKEALINDTGPKQTIYCKRK